MMRVAPPERCGGKWPPVAEWTPIEWGHWMRGVGYEQATIYQYLREREGYGLVTRVARKGNPEGEATVHYVPTPRQWEFHKCRAANVLFGGAVGGAKSHALRWDAYIRCLAKPGLSAILFRRTLTELRDNHLLLTQRDFHGPVLSQLGRFMTSEKAVAFNNGSVLRFAHCEHEGDEEQYLSSEYDWIGLDEIVTFSERQATGIMTRARSSKPGVEAVVRAGTNPGGAHTLWVADYFIHHSVTEDRNPYYEPADYAYVPSKLYDNPYLMDRDGTWVKYERRLGALSAERRRQLLEGDWSAIAGQYFPEFSRERHVRVQTIPEGSRVFRCLDWGYTAPGVCYWLVVLPDGHVHVQHEYVFQHTLAVEVAREIKRRTQMLGLERPSYTAADPSMFARTGAGFHGESHAETFARAGVPLTRADNDRELGWQRMRHWFADLADGRPGLTVDPSCGYLIRTLPALVSDVHKPEDVDTTGDDHGADALRYGLMSRPAPNRPVEVPLPKNSVGALLAQLRRPERTVLGSESVGRV